MPQGLYKVCPQAFPLSSYLRFYGKGFLVMRGKYSDRNFLVQTLPHAQQQKIPAPSDEVSFGFARTSHMLVCDFIDEWKTPKILPYAPFEFFPDSIVFHYGQQIFEGMKVYQHVQNQKMLNFFRPQLNARRFFNSAVRMGMEPVPEELFIDCIKELVGVDSQWVLPHPWSLYVRPTLIPLDVGVSYRASASYRFFVILSPVKDYYVNPSGVSVVIERENSRAFPGGVGEAKCGGNYAAAILALKKAKQLGAEQVMWLDAHEKKYIEEVGAMNIFFVYEDRIETPALSGSILPGITRDSLLELIPEKIGIPVFEKKIEVEKVLKDAKSGSLKEVFGCGTAAVISCVTEFKNGNECVLVSGGNAGEVSLKLKEILTKIQTGEVLSNNNWCESILI
jgi:branched-chain amino acid aminotransferase